MYMCLFCFVLYKFVSVWVLVLFSLFVSTFLLAFFSSVFFVCVWNKKNCKGMQWLGDGDGNEWMNGPRVKTSGKQSEISLTPVFIHNKCFVITTYFFFSALAQENLRTQRNSLIIHFFSLSDFTYVCNFYEHGVDEHWEKLKHIDTIAESKNTHSHAQYALKTITFNCLSGFSKVHLKYDNKININNIDFDIDIGTGINIIIFNNMVGIFMRSPLSPTLSSWQCLGNPHQFHVV